MNHGTTIHSKLLIPIIGEPNFNIKSNTTALKRLQDALEGVKYIIIDEISMVGQRLFAWINVRLQAASGNNAPFGGYHVIIVGDFAQTPAIGDLPLWKPPYEGKGNLEGYTLYREYFKTVVMLADKDNMRQL